ncbi:MAG: molecular chaperone HtpG, partial [Bacteroidota bacterium]
MKGTISVNTENIFPIIKKSLYSNQEVFLRELVSNAVDATQKLKALSNMGQYSKELGELNIEVKIDQEAKTLSIIDRGLGMTADEINKYI